MEDIDMNKVTPEKLPTQANLKQEAWRIFAKARQDALVAPERRGWSKTFGVQIPSANDIMRKATNDLRRLNEIATSFGYKPVWEDPEEESPVNLGKVK